MTHCKQRAGCEPQDVLWGGMTLHAPSCLGGISGLHHAKVLRAKGRADGRVAEALGFTEWQRPRLPWSGRLASSGSMLISRFFKQLPCINSGETKHYLVLSGIQGHV